MNISGNAVAKLTGYKKDMEMFEALKGSAKNFVVAVEQHDNDFGFDIKMFTTDADFDTIIKLYGDDVQITDLVSSRERIEGMIPDYGTMTYEEFEKALSDLLGTQMAKERDGMKGV